tara:strand:+ start:457 stop:642 length:186 start_codon:yes stop_codon:yes gene_type:complete
MEKLEYKNDYKDQDYIDGLYHILRCIDQKGVHKCSKDTRVAYDILKDLTYKLSNTHVLYQP